MSFDNILSLLLRTRCYALIFFPILETIGNMLLWLELNRNKLNERLLLLKDAIDKEGKKEVLSFLFATSK